MKIIQIFILTTFFSIYSHAKNSLQISYSNLVELHQRTNQTFLLELFDLNRQYVTNIETLVVIANEYLLTPSREADAGELLVSLEEKEHNAETWYMLGLYEYGRKNYSEAVWYFERAWKFSGEKMFSAAKSAYFAMTLTKRHNEAKVLLSDLSALVPSDLLKATDALIRNKPQESRTFLAQAFKDPMDPSFYFLSGLALEHVGMDDKANDLYLFASSLQPENRYFVAKSIEMQYKVEAVELASKKKIMTIAIDNAEKDLFLTDLQIRNKISLIKRMIDKKDYEKALSESHTILNANALEFEGVVHFLNSEIFYSVGILDLAKRSIAFAEKRPGLEYYDKAALEKQRKKIEKGVSENDFKLETLRTLQMTKTPKEQFFDYAFNIYMDQQGLNFISPQTKSNFTLTIRNRVTEVQQILRVPLALSFPTNSLFQGELKKIEIVKTVRGKSEKITRIVLNSDLSTNYIEELTPSGTPLFYQIYKYTKENVLGAIYFGPTKTNYSGMTEFVYSNGVLDGLKRYSGETLLSTQLFRDKGSFFLGHGNGISIANKIVTNQIREGEAPQTERTIWWNSGGEGGTRREQEFYSNNLLIRKVNYNDNIFYSEVRYSYRESRLWKEITYDIDGREKERNNYYYFFK